MNIAFGFIYFVCLNILFICLSCNEIRTTSKESALYKSFNGRWYWQSRDKKDAFLISLKTKGDSIIGYYCAMHDLGNRLDCGSEEADNNIRRIVESGKANVSFFSFYNATNGAAELYFDTDGFLIWKIEKNPVGAECYAPLKARLSNKKAW
jgi:hypothetical protein